MRPCPTIRRPGCGCSSKVSTPLRFLRWLAPAGRMALTTYVSQTLIGVLLFYGIGLGLGHTLGFGAATALAVAIFALQCIASRIWLQAFRFGPLEWIWRRATYGTAI